MSSWALPTDAVQVPVLGEIWFGDHTWVTADDRSCWSVLGGGPEFYCRNRWDGNTYTPPTITWRGNQVTGRQLTSAPGESSKADCMGGAPGSFAGIPTYAGIIYGVHGVCHQMANRLLLTSDRIVSAADGFPLSSASYGIYGTSVPGFVWAAAFWAPPVLAALTGYVLGMNAAFAVACASCGVRYPGPVMAAGEASDEQRLIREVLEIHGVGAPFQAAAGPPSVEGIDAGLDGSRARHLRELELLLEFRSRGRVSPRKLERVRDSYAEFLRPDPEAVAVVAARAQVEPEPSEGDAADPVQLERFAVEANREALAQQDRVADILGAEDFERVFGVHPDVKVGLVDPRQLGVGRDPVA